VDHRNDDPAIVVPQQLDQPADAVGEDACLEALQLAGQRPGRLGVFRIELADLRIEQFIEVGRRPLRG
jgi:hypothetical protein